MVKRQNLRQGLILVSFFLFPATFYYLSPVLILEAASYGIVNGSFIVFGLLFLSAVVLGRGWCGWLCPAAGCQEALFKVRNKKVLKGNWIKWIVWFPWIGGIAILAIKRFGIVSKIGFIKWWAKNKGFPGGNFHTSTRNYLA